MEKAITIIKKTLKVINGFSINYHIFPAITLISFLLPPLGLLVTSVFLCNKLSNILCGWVLIYFWEIRLKAQLKEATSWETLFQCDAFFNLDFYEDIFMQQ